MYWFEIILPSSFLHNTSFRQSCPTASSSDKHFLPGKAEQPTSLQLFIAQSFPKTWEKLTLKGSYWSKSKVNRYTFTLNRIFLKTVYNDIKTTFAFYHGWKNQHKENKIQALLHVAKRFQLQLIHDFHNETHMPLKNMKISWAWHK